MNKKGVRVEIPRKSAPGRHSGSSGGDAGDDGSVSSGGSSSSWKTVRSTKNANTPPSGNLTAAAAALFREVYKTNLNKDPKAVRKAMDAWSAQGNDVDEECLRRIIDELGVAKKWKQAVAVFQEAEAFGVPQDAILYNSAIGALGRSGRGEDAVGLYAEMTACGVDADASGSTYRRVLIAAGKAGLWEDAERVYGDMLLDGFPPATYDVNNLMMACLHGGRGDRALAAFGEIERFHLEPDAHTYTFVMKGYALAGRWAEAEAWMRRAEEVGAAGPGGDVYMLNALLLAFKVAGEAQRALRVLEGMKAAGPQPTGLSYNLVVAALASSPSARDRQSAVCFHAEMVGKGHVPSLETFNALLLSASAARQYTECTRLFTSMRAANVKPDAATYSAVVTTCAETDRCSEALGHFDSMCAVGLQPDAPAYNALVTCVASLGKRQDAARVVEAMRKASAEPDAAAAEALGRLGLHDAPHGRSSQGGAAGAALEDVCFTAASPSAWQEKMPQLPTGKEDSGEASSQLALGQRSQWPELQAAKPAEAEQPPSQIALPASLARQPGAATASASVAAPGLEASGGAAPLAGSTVDTGLVSAPPVGVAARGPPPGLELKGGANQQGAPLSRAAGALTAPTAGKVARAPPPGFGRQPVHGGETPVDRRDTFTCTVCALDLNSSAQLEQHLGGSRHAQVAMEAAGGGARSPPPPLDVGAAGKAMAAELPDPGGPPEPKASPRPRSPDSVLEGAAGEAMAAEPPAPGADLAPAAYCPRPPSPPTPLPSFVIKKATPGAVDLDASRGSEVRDGSRATSRRTSSTESDRWEVEDAAEQALQAFKDLVGLGLRPLELEECAGCFSACLDGGREDHAMYIFDGMIAEGLAPPPPMYAAAFGILRRQRLGGSIVHRYLEGAAAEVLESPAVWAAAVDALWGDAPGDPSSYLACAVFGAAQARGVFPGECAYESSSIDIAALPPGAAECAVASWLVSEGTCPPPRYARGRAPSPGGEAPPSALFPLVISAGSPASRGHLEGMLQAMGLPFEDVGDGSGRLVCGSWHLDRALASPTALTAHLRSAFEGEGALKLKL